MTPQSQPESTGFRAAPQHPLRDSVHLFICGALMDGDAGLLEGCTRVRDASAQGMLYDVAGDFPALMLAGEDTVHGEIWQCAPERIHELDRHEAARSRLFRRVGLEVEGIACWTYVAGPALGTRLAHARRLPGGRWTGAAMVAGDEND